VSNFGPTRGVLIGTELRTQRKRREAPLYTLAFNLLTYEHPKFDALPNITKMSLSAQFLIFPTARNFQKTPTAAGISKIIADHTGDARYSFLVRVRLGLWVLVADTVTNYTPSARGAGERERAPANTAFFPTAATEEIDKDPSDAGAPTQKIKSLSKDTSAPQPNQNHLDSTPRKKFLKSQNIWPPR
jgi:hypothetical protein